MVGKYDYFAGHFVCRSRSFSSGIGKICQTCLRWPTDFAKPEFGHLFLEFPCIEEVLSCLLLFIFGNRTLLRKLWSFTVLHVFQEPPRVPPRKFVRKLSACEDLVFYSIVERMGRRLDAFTSFESCIGVMIHCLLGHISIMALKIGK